MKTTVNYKGVDLEVTYDYTPEELPVFYYADGSGHPGSPAQVEIISIMFKGADFTDMLESCYPEIEEIILEQI